MIQSCSVELYVVIYLNGIETNQMKLRSLC